MSSNIAKFLALDKAANLFRIIQQNGGITGCFFKLFRQDELKYGEFVGEDKFGNKYYENPRYFYGRNRWVEYHERYYLNYDASLVPPEWYGWLHYKTDALPHNDPHRPHYPWMLEHTENLSGTTGQYVPYSTTRPKIEAWVPKQKESK